MTRSGGCRCGGQEAVERLVRGLRGLSLKTAEGGNVVQGSLSSLPVLEEREEEEGEELHCIITERQPISSRRLSECCPGEESAAVPRRHRHLSSPDMRYIIVRIYAYGARF